MPGWRDRMAQMKLKKELKELWEFNTATIENFNWLGKIMVLPFLIPSLVVTSLIVVFIWLIIKKEPSK